MPLLDHLFFRFKICPFPFHENASSVSWTIFKAFTIFMLDFAGDGQSDLPASQNQEQISEYKCSFYQDTTLFNNIRNDRTCTHHKVHK